MEFVAQLVLVLLTIPQESISQPAIDGVAPRRFHLSYGASVDDLPANSTVRVWFPIPQTDEFQKIKILQTDVPSTLAQNKEKQYGNLVGYFETTVDNSNSIQFNINYEVARLEAKADTLGHKLKEHQQRTFLAANRLVPVTGAPVKLLDGKPLPPEPIKIGRELYEIVEAYMAYDKSKPGYGNGDVLWACSSSSGNCTDFHSLFISLARSQNIPARFEIGFPIPTDKHSGPIDGYHCWAWFHTDEQGWVPVDISEADKNPRMKEYFFGRLTPDRVAFSTGRDVQLVPRSVAEPLNYFVYPHVEIDGKICPKEKIKLRFAFTDLQGKG